MRVYSPSQGIDLLKQVPAEEPPPSDVSQVESALRGAAQGASFGFADELTGAIEAGLINPEKTYEQARNESRANYAKAQEANPGTYIAGNVGGAILPALVSGGTSAVGSGLSTAGLIGSAGAKTIAGLVGQGALQGGLQGLGESEGDNIGDIARDVATGTALGGTTAGLVGGASRGISKAVDALPSAGTIKQGIENRIAGGITGLSDEGVDVLRKTPDALNRIESLGEGTKDDILDRATEEVKAFIQKNPIKQRIDQNYEKAYSALEKSGVTVDPSQAKQILEKRVNDLNIGGKRAFSDTDIMAQNKLQDYLDRLDELSQGGEISATDTKALIGQIRNDIDSYGSKANQAGNPVVQNALKELQAYFDTSVLKKDIPEFKNIMKKIAKDMRLASDIDSTFISRIGKNYDVDPNKIKNLLKGELSSSTKPRQSELTRQLSSKMQAFDRLGGESGGSSLQDTIENLKLKQLMDTRSNQGSNLVNFGTGLGAAFGGTVGGLIGGTEGAAIGASIGGGAGTFGGKRAETQARKLTSSYFERQANQAPQIISKVQGTKYAPVLQNAAQRGTRNFAVAHYLLQQQDPDYRQMTEGDANVED